MEHRHHGGGTPPGLHHTIFSLSVLPACPGSWGRLSSAPRAFLCLAFTILPLGHSSDAVESTESWATNASASGTQYRPKRSEGFRNNSSTGHPANEPHPTPSL